MTKEQAKKLKAQDKVFLIKGEDKTLGVVLAKRWNSISILWYGLGEATLHRADEMEKIFTQEQLDAEETNKRVLAGVEEWKKANVNRPPNW